LGSTFNPQFSFSFGRCQTGWLFSALLAFLFLCSTRFPPYFLLSQTPLPPVGSLDQTSRAACCPTLFSPSSSFYSIQTRVVFHCGRLFWFLSFGPPPEQIKVFEQHCSPPFPAFTSYSVFYVTLATFHSSPPPPLEAKSFFGSPVSVFPFVSRHPPFMFVLGRRGAVFSFFLSLRRISVVSFSVETWLA